MADSILDPNCIAEQEEVWLPVPKIGTYLVSSFGRVMRVAGTYGCVSGRILRQKTTRHGYKQVALSLGKKRSYWHVGVHALVLEAFRGTRPTNMHEAAHGDGNKTNNRLSNLRWATPKENAKDRDMHGTTAHLKGCRHGHHILNDAMVSEIRNRHKSGESAISLATEFNVGRSTIFDALASRTWGHVQ